MFNMYDDVGVKTVVQNPYKLKELEAIAPTHNRVTEEKNRQQEQSSEYKMSEEAKKVYKNMANLHVEEEILHVSQLMHSEVVTVRETETIHECWLKMEEHNLKQIPIVKVNGNIKGLATMTNIAKSLIEHRDNPDYIDHTSINSIAIKDVMTVEPVTDVRIRYCCYLFINLIHSSSCLCS